MKTYDRVKDVLADGDWHTIEELKLVSDFPELWIEEFRRDGIEVAQEDDRVALVGVASAS